METMVHAVVYIGVIVDTIGFQSLFISRPRAIDSIVQGGKMQTQRGLYATAQRLGRWCALEGRAGVQIIGQCCGQHIDHIAAIAEAHRTELAITERMIFEE